jgi:hypothetical protein
LKKVLAGKAQAQAAEPVEPVAVLVPAVEAEGELVVVAAVVAVPALCRPRQAAQNLLGSLMGGMAGGTKVGGMLGAHGGGGPLGFLGGALGKMAAGVSKHEVTGAANLDINLKGLPN